MSDNTVEAGSDPARPTVARRAKIRSDGGPRASGVAVAALIISLVALGAVFATLLVTLHRQQNQDASAAAAAPSPQPTVSGPTAANQAAPPRVEPTPEGAQTQRSDASKAVSDEAMQRELNMKLATDPQLAFHPLDATVQNGRVRLRGTLPDKSLKQRAESIARSIKGVKEVADLISVQAG